MPFSEHLDLASQTSNGRVMFENLDEVRRDWVERLTHAARQRKSPMHVPTVVTSDVDARIMVLRDFDTDTCTMRFHTDIRAPKVAVIEADPRMAVLLYDKGEKVQIRARGVGRIVRDGPMANAAWAESDNFARRCYLGEGPGALDDAPTSGLPAEFEGIEPTDDQLVPARVNFAILLVELTEVDWFYLAHTGHMRAQFVRDEGGPSGQWQGRWVSP